MLLAAIPRVEQRRIVRFFTAAPAVMGIFVSAVAVAELILVFARIVSPTDSSLYVMPPLTSITFIVAGFALTSAQRKLSSVWKWISRVLAIIVGAIGLAVLFEFALQRGSVLDSFWSRLLGPGHPFAGWQVMAINSALAFVLFAQGIMFLDG